jgi:hypothetical protein
MCFAAAAEDHTPPDTRNFRLDIKDNYEGVADVFADKIPQAVLDAAKENAGLEAILKAPHHKLVTTIEVCRTTISIINPTHTERDSEREREREREIESE